MRRGEECSLGMGHRPQVLLQKPFMNAALHCPKDFCWAQVNEPSFPGAGAMSAHPPVPEAAAAPSIHACAQ